MTMMMGGKVHRTRSKARRSAGGVPGAFLQGVDGTRIPLTPDDYRRVRSFCLQSRNGRWRMTSVSRLARRRVFLGSPNARSHACWTRA